MIDAPEKPTWDGLKELLAWAAVLFGRPSELAAKAVVSRRQGLLIRCWLCALEAIARALLVLMAAAMNKSALAQKQSQDAGQSQAAARPDAGAQSSDAGGFDPSSDEAAPDEAAPGAADPGAAESSRRAAFRCLPSARSGGRGGESAPQDFISTLRLASRLEALFALAEAPDACARRLARRLHQNFALACRVLREPRLPAQHSYPREDVGSALAHAWMAADAFAANSG